MQNPMSNYSFSHLRWDFVYQRPQHLRRAWPPHRILFVEEPLQRIGRECQMGENPAGARK